MISTKDLLVAIGVMAMFSIAGCGDDGKPASHLVGPTNNTDDGSSLGVAPLDTTYMNQSLAQDFAVLNGGKWHTGYDISTKDKNPSVLSVADGTVVWNSTASYKDSTDYWKYYNAFVIVKHGGFYAYYGHLNSSLAIGDSVHQGASIGTIRDAYEGNDKLNRGNNHLHISISTGSDWVKYGWGYQATESDVKSKFVNPRNYIGL